MLPETFGQCTEVYKCSGDTAVDEDDDEEFEDDFEIAVARILGNYFDERLTHKEVRDSYQKHSKELETYKESSAYIQARKKCDIDQTLFKKNMKDYESIL